MIARLTSGMLVASVLRRTQGEGGFATVVHRGDATAGGILVLCRERDILVALLERLLGAGSHYGWQRVGPDAADSAALDAYLQRRVQRDPDLWVVELDIPDSERFAAESLPTS